MGDYCSGTNHVLPTYGFARAYSGLSLVDFMKRMTVQEVTADGLRDLGPTAITIAATRRTGCPRQRRARPAAPNSTPEARMNRILRAGAARTFSLLQPYQHAAWEPSLERMHANEMPWRATGDASIAGLNRYPEPQPEELIDASGAAVRSRAGRSARGPRQRRRYRSAGARLLSRRRRTACSSVRPRSACTRCRRGSRALASIEVPLVKERGFALDVPTVLAHWRPGVKLVFLCTPNNPTGNLLDRNAIDTAVLAAGGTCDRGRRRGVHRVRSE